MPERRVHDTGTDKLRAEVDVAERVATLTFDNPARRNALSADMRAALPGALRTLERDDDVRVVVVRGGGDKAFVSGADISEFGDRRTDPGDRAEFDALGAEVDRAWGALGKPVIAMIRGWCLGGGLLTALQADIRVAADDARFGVPAARLGLGYAYSGVEALVGLVGWGATSEILLSARHLDAAEALAIGLVNRVVPVAELDATVADLARTIAANAPLTLAACKAAIRQARRDPADRDLAHVGALVEACFQSDDYEEGQRAFAEKRPPRFTGR